MGVSPFTRYSLHRSGITEKVKETSSMGKNGCAAISMVSHQSMRRIAGFYGNLRVDRHYNRSLHRLVTDLT